MTKFKWHRVLGTCFNLGSTFGRNVFGMTQLLTSNLSYFYVFVAICFVRILSPCNFHQGALLVSVFVEVQISSSDHPKKLNGAPLSVRIRLLAYSRPELPGSCPRGEHLDTMLSHARRDYPRVES